MFLLLTRPSPPTRVFLRRLSTTSLNAGSKILATLRVKDLETGEEMVRSNEPVSIIVGMGHLLPGLDRRLLRSFVGETFTEVLAPDEAFGVTDPTRVYRLPHPKEFKPSLGEKLKTDTGEFGVIVKMDERDVWLDMNHPMANKRIEFTVSVVGLDGDQEEPVSGVKVITIRPGDAKTYPKQGSKVNVHYVGTLAENGKEFDSSRRPGRQPFSFVLGAGLVIRGWDLGVGKLSLGERATLYIPAEMGYGSRGAPGAIPPNANLVFDVELLEIDGKAAPSRGDVKLE